MSNYYDGIADSSASLGYCYWRSSYYSLSFGHSLRALKTCRNLGQMAGEAGTLNTIGELYIFQDDCAMGNEL